MVFKIPLLIHCKNKNNTATAARSAHIKEKEVEKSKMNSPSAPTEQRMHPTCTCMVKIKSSGWGSSKLLPEHVLVPRCQHHEPGSSKLAEKPDKTLTDVCTVSLLAPKNSRFRSLTHTWAMAFFPIVTDCKGQRVASDLLPLPHSRGTAREGRMCSQESRGAKGRARGRGLKVVFL